MNLVEFLCRKKKRRQPPDADRRCCCYCHSLPPVFSVLLLKLIQAFNHFTYKCAPFLLSFLHICTPHPFPFTFYAGFGDASGLFVYNSAIFMPKRHERHHRRNPDGVSCEFWIWPVHASVLKYSSEVSRLQTDGWSRYFVMRPFLFLWLLLKLFSLHFLPRNSTRVGH